MTKKNEDTTFQCELSTTKKKCLSEWLRRSSQSRDPNSVLSSYPLPI